MLFETGGRRDESEDLRGQTNEGPVVRQAVPL